MAAGERSAPRGTLTSPRPSLPVKTILRSILDAFMNEYQMVAARLYLLDRPVNLIDEGIDVALRIAHLADSNFVAIRLGEVRRVIAASPGYLAQHPSSTSRPIWRSIGSSAMTHFGLDSWSFPPLEGSSVPRTVQFAPRLVVNTVRAAVASATEGHGVTRLFSYHIADEIRDGRLQILLGKDEHPPLAVPICSAPQGRFSVPKVRAFVDFAVPRLKRYFTQLSTDATRNDAAIRSQRGRLPAE